MNAILLPILLTIANMPATPDIVVVCPSEFRAAMQPWVDRRTQRPAPIPARIRAALEPLLVAGVE